MTATAADSRPTPDEVLDVVREALAVVCEQPAGLIHAETLLAALGADSLARVELAELVEQRFARQLPDLHIPDDDLAAFCTVGDTVAYVVARL